MGLIPRKGGATEGIILTRQAHFVTVVEAGHPNPAKQPADGEFHALHIALQQGQELIGDDWQAVWGPVAYVKAGLFELENGLCTHLDSAQISGILNPDATPDTGFAWNAGTSSAPVWLTPAQMQAGQSATPIAWADQVLYQHIHAYTELVLGTSPEPAQNQG